jgi:hypothetical protein
VDPEKARTNTPAAWAKQTLAKLDTPQVKGMEQQVVRTLLNNPVTASVKLPEITPTLVAIVGGTLISLYLFFSYCCMLICKKAGHQAGALVWLPVFQVLPMLRAARMSGWWFLALFVPVLNLVTQILWCIKIVQARDKNGWLALLLLLPLTNIFAFLFLAFADGEPPKKEQRAVAEIMTLETA